MRIRESRCPRCEQRYPWGQTVCPTCHVGLTFGKTAPSTAPDVVVFETGDRSSADIVAGLLTTNGLDCVIRGTDNRLNIALRWTGYWRVLVRAQDEARAQEILDAEIGREDTADPPR